jgi:hypothetical protein
MEPEASMANTYNNILNCVEIMETNMCVWGKVRRLQI